MNDSYSGQRIILHQAFYSKDSSAEKHLWAKCCKRATNPFVFLLIEMSGQSEVFLFAVLRQWEQALMN